MLLCQCLFLLTAGGSVEPFWGLYQQHQKQEIRDIIEQYRIGSLKGGARPAINIEDPYKHEPSRHPALLVRSAKPFNGETPAELLVAAPITPIDMFFTRHHLPVPVVDTDTYKVMVGGAADGVATGVRILLHPTAPSRILSWQSGYPPR